MTYKKAITDFNPTLVRLGLLNCLVAAFQASDFNPTLVRLGQGADSIVGGFVVRISILP